DPGGAAGLPPAAADGRRRRGRRGRALPVEHLAAYDRCGRRAGRRGARLANADVRGDLIEDPAVGALETVDEADARLPAKVLEDQRIVARAPANPLRGREVVAPGDLDAGDLLDDVDEPIDR